MNSIKKCVVTISVCGLFCIAFFLFSFKEPPQTKQKTILVIFPHPDDETAIAEVLVKYAALGYKVQLMIATDGKNGTRVTTIPAGDSLGNLRKDETRCACEIMAIEKPILLGIERLDTKIGVGKYFEEHKKLLQLLKEQIPLINPDFIITFGPDGDTHHAEHIVLGSAVTELLLKEGWVDKYPLYYVAWTKDQGEAFELGFVNEKYFNVKIEYTLEEENKALQIMPCYVTQYTAEEIAEDRNKKETDKNNSIHFRKLEIDRSGLKTEFPSKQESEANTYAEIQDVTETLKAMEYRAIMSEFTLDTTTIAAMMDNNFISIYPSKTQNKQQELNGIHSSMTERIKGAHIVDSLYLDDFKVQLFDNTAIATFYTVSKGTKKGVPFENFRMRWYDVWINRDGEWKWISSQGTLK
ncbi:MAG: PIG-L family deacetylase [Aquaticitalea sp.]